VLGWVSVLLLVIPQPWSISFSYTLWKAPSVLLVWAGVLSMGLQAYELLLVTGWQVWLLWRACQPTRLTPSFPTALPVSEGRHA
jgi:hypothetical protein